jgi:hypothetical protein
VGPSCRAVITAIFNCTSIPLIFHTAEPPPPTHISEVFTGPCVDLLYTLIQNWKQVTIARQQLPIQLQSGLGFFLLAFFLSFDVYPRRLLLHLITLSDTHTHTHTPHSVGLLWTSNRHLISLKTHERQISMLSAGFKPAVPASERPQTQALDCAATGIGLYVFQLQLYST